MSLNNYASLKTSIANFLARKDLDASIPDFISICESRLNNNHEFRVRKMVCKLVANIHGSEIAMPPDYLGMRVIRHTRGTALKQVSAEAISSVKSCSDVDERVYCELGNRLEIYPEANDVEMDLFYYQKIPPLSDTNLSNWLLAQSPETYLYGSLLAASQFMKNDDRVPMWEKFYADAVGGLIGADKSDRWSGQLSVSL